MKIKTILIPIAAGGRFVFTALLLVIGTCASRAYDKNSVVDAWNGYNTWFLFSYSDGSQGYLDQEGGSTTSSGFWQDAEKLEMAEDVFYFEKANSIDTTDTKALVQSLAYGFAGHNKYADSTDNWGADGFNDDLCWASIAMARAYQITGVSRFLNAAEVNMTNVWGRARMYDAGNNFIGLRQAQSNTNAEANVNFAFVVANYLIFTNSGNATYKSRADAVYGWAIDNLYNSSLGKVWDSASDHSDYAYNYGIAIHAAALEQAGAVCSLMANYLEYSAFSGGCYPTNGLTTEGDRVLPNYAHDGCTGDTARDGNNVGYDGICLRGVGFAISRGYISGPITTWAQDNLTLANSQANSDYLIWTDWQAPTESSDNYSWNCSSALAGLADIPLP